MLKLCRHLYAWDPRAGILRLLRACAAESPHRHHPPTPWHTQYYLSLTPGVWKTFDTEDQTFWCCTGSGIEEFAKLNDSIYWRDDDGVYVNLFIASELDWPEARFALRQDTTYPDSETHGLHHRRRRPSSRSRFDCVFRVAAFLARSDAQRNACSKHPRRPGVI